MPARPQPHRLVALDWMRGIVMVLMAVDHASIMLNPGRTSHDSAANYVVGTQLDTLQFFTRWITHLCAPTFVFLAGTALALSAARRRAKGETRQQTDRDLVIRGVILIGLDVFWMRMLAPAPIFQVLYAIGLSMILMVPLRRLPGRTLLAVGLGWFALGELITVAIWDPASGMASPPVALTVGFVESPEFIALYPVIPWLAIMILGWAFGDYLQQSSVRTGVRPPASVLLRWGASALVVFAVVRGFNGYGNMHLFRGDGSLVQWLHVSKYPPSITFATLELGLMAIVLAGLIRLEPRVKVALNGPILVFGQTALFFYLLHFLLLGTAAFGFGLAGRGDVGSAYIGALAVSAVLYPLCLLYRRYKQAHPRSWVRYI